MRFTNICLEGPDCSGKTTLFNNIHKQTNYKYNIQDRSCLSMFVFSRMYDRDSKFWFEKLMSDLKRLDTLYVLLLPPKETVVERIKKRGDNIQDENSIIDVWNAFDLICNNTFRFNNLPNFIVIDAVDKEKSVSEVLDKIDYLNSAPGSELIKNLVVESNENELVDISCSTNVNIDNLNYAALEFKEEKEYYVEIRNKFFTKIQKEFMGLICDKPQTHDSRRFIYTDDSCISMIHLLCRNNSIDFNVVMRSSNVIKTLWADYEFLKVLAYESMEELGFKNIPVKLNLNIRSAHIVP